MAESRGIEIKWGYELTEVRFNKVTDYHRINEAIFKDAAGKEVTMDYGHLNMYPGGKIPKAIQGTKLVNKEGMIPINKYTL